MRSRIPVTWVMMLAALLLSLVPAAAITARPAEALAPCNWAKFISDVTVPDGTNVALGLTFAKTWRLTNIGTCTWTTSYALVFSSGDQLGGPASVPLPKNVAPGQTVDVSVNLTAPTTPGHYIGFWQLKNASGALFGIGSNANKTWWVDINVLPASNFGVAYDFAANYCSANWYSTQGNLPCPGADGDSRGFVLKVDNPQLETGNPETGSGLVLMPQNAFNGDIHGTFPAFHVESGDRFRSIVNCAFGATSCFVTFRLDYQIGDGPINTFWSLREKYDGLFFRTDLDLSRLAGQDVKFILTVLANGSADGDRALWSNPVIARAGPVPPAPYARNFDFGTSTSPLATGYTRVTQATAYTTGGFGWASPSGLESRDRGSPSDALKRDFVMGSSSAGTFKVDLPNGTYTIAVTMGDNNASHDNMVVKANGTTVLADVDTAAGAFSVNTFNATVSSDTLSLEFSDAGGSSPSWVVNGIAISSGSTPPPAGCDRAQFVTDVTVPDGTTFAPGAAFTKTWRLKNVGTCTWTTAYALVFDSGEKMGGPDSVAMPKSVAPGATVDVPVNLTAPSVAGSYRGFWKFQSASGVRFGVGTAGTQPWFVDIRVAGTALGRNYDFGTASSPVASGYNRVTESTAYTSGGFGWTDTSTLESRDRSGVSDALKRDFVMDSSAARTFQVDLPNGSYAVNVLMGDRDHAHDNMVIKANGTTLIGDVDTALGSYASNTFNVTTTTGSLALEFSDAGGTDPTWVVNALTIAAGSTLPAACDRAQFVTDVTVPDGTAFAPGVGFTKTWRLKNVGTCTWTTAYALVFDTGDKMGGPDSVNLPKAVAPGQTVDVSVSLTAPATTGSVRGFWRFQNASGVRFGLGAAGTKSWWVDIKVAGADTTGWNTYLNSRYSFGFKIPPGSSIASQSDTGGRVELPFVAGTTLTGKWIDLTVVEGANPCKSPNAGQVSSSENTTINGIQFLKEIGMEGTAGHFYNITAYSTLKNNACISLTFVLKSVDPGVFTTPPPAFNKAAESAVFPIIMSTYAAIASTPTPTPTATTTPTTSTPVPGLILRGYVRLQDGSGLPGVTICRSFASYDGVVVATTDANGYFQSDFTFIPGDEMVTVWPVASGYTFQPDSVYWRHYYGPEDRTANFTASPGSPTQAATIPCPTGTTTPSTGTPTPTQTPTQTQTPPPTSTSTPTPTAPGGDTTGWNTYLNSKYLFSFKFPPGSSIMSQSDNVGRVYLPITPGTNLSQKWVSVAVVEGADPCKSPTTGIVLSTETVTINGIQFFNEISMDGAAGSTYDATAYSTLKGNACISLTFVLRAANLGNFETPPPAFDKAAESAVFQTIMSTYKNE